MIYIDDDNIKRKVGRSTRRWFHMMAIPMNEDELIAFGNGIGLNSKWIQRSRSGLIHYDITAGMKKKALAAGACQITKRQMVSLIERTRNELQNSTI